MEEKVLRLRWVGVLRMQSVQSVRALAHRRYTLASLVNRIHSRVSQLLLPLSLATKFFERLAPAVPLLRLRNPLICDERPRGHKTGKDQQDVAEPSLLIRIVRAIELDVAQEYLCDDRA